MQSRAQTLWRNGWLVATCLSGFAVQAMDLKQVYE